LTTAAEKNPCRCFIAKYQLAFLTDRTKFAILSLVNKLTVLQLTL